MGAMAGRTVGDFEGRTDEACARGIDGGDIAERTKRPSSAGGFDICRWSAVRVRGTIDESNSSIDSELFQMYQLAAFGLVVLILGILSGGVLALVALGLGAFTYGVRRLDSDVNAWDGLATGFASRL